MAAITLSSTPNVTPNVTQPPASVTPQNTGIPTDAATKIGQANSVAHTGNVIGSPLPPTAAPTTPATTPATTTPTAPKPTGTAVPQSDGSTKTYTDENGNPWDINNFHNDYSAEIDKLQSINPADPRINVLEQARANKILADPNNPQYKGMLGWANDIKSGQWNPQDYSGNYQAEIDRLRATNPADPRIDKLEHLRAQKILSNPSIYDQQTKDWAVDKDRSNWNVNNYANDYSAEINRIKAFNPNDPRIQQLTDAKAAKVLANPSAYPDLVQWAQDYSKTAADRMAQENLANQYQQQEVQGDIQTQQAVKTIEDYYKRAGIQGGGQEEAAIRQAAMQGLQGQQGMQQQEQAAMSNLVNQQQATNSQNALSKAQQDIQKEQLNQAAAAAGLPIPFPEVRKKK